MTQYVDGIRFETEICCSCGMPFAITAHFQKNRLNDHKSFYCPAGHAQHYTGKSEEQKLKERLERERSIREAAEARANKAESQHKQIAKAHTKMRNRVMNGVCPCCNRTFQNLMKHMQSQHSNELTLKHIRESYGMTQSAVAQEIGINSIYISLAEREKPVPRYADTAIRAWMESQVIV